MLYDIDIDRVGVHDKGEDRTCKAENNILV